MSRVLAAHLARECREQRFVLGGSAVVLALAAAAGAPLVARGAIHPEHLRLCLCFYGLVLFLVAIAGDLLSGDAQRGTKGFLARTPRGLGAAFQGKLALLLLTTPVLPLLGFGLGSAVATLRDPALARSMPQSVDVYVVLPLLLLALWTFAASAFVKRAVLALPLALLMLAPVIAITLATLPGSARAWKTTPFWCTWLDTPGFGLAYLAALGLLVARLAFVRRPRRGAIAAALGMPLLLVPGLVVLYRANTPTAHELRFHGGGVDSAGTRAQFFAQDARSRYHWIVGVDPGTGRVTRLEEHDADLLRTDDRGAIDLPDGARARLTTSAIVVERNGVELAVLAWKPWLGVARGYGMQVCADAKLAVRDEPRETIDLVRRIHVSEPRWYPGGCIVLARDWLVGERMPRVPHRFRAWRLRDPVTGAERPAPGMRDGDQVVALLLDGGVLVESPLDRTRVLRFAVDLEAGTRMPVLGAGAREVRYVATAHDRDWFAGSQGLCSLAPGDFALRLDAPTGQYVGPLANGRVLAKAADDSELLVIEARSGASTRIYPR